MIRAVIALTALLAAPVSAQTLSSTGLKRQLSAARDQMTADTAAQIATARSQMQAIVDAEIAQAVAATQNKPGAKGDKGDKGDTGAPGVGTPGPAGAPGTAGVAGRDGVSPALSIGTVSTLAAGQPATAALRGTTAAPILDLGLPSGIAGVAGAAATSTATMLPNATLTETATVALAVGPRTATASVAGLLVTDRILVTPTAALPVGYVLGDAYSVAPGVLTLDFYGPAIAIGASRTFTVRVTVFR